MNGDVRIRMRRASRLSDRTALFLTMFVLLLSLGVLPERSVRAAEGDEPDVVVVPDGAALSLLGTTYESLTSADPLDELSDVCTGLDDPSLCNDFAMGNDGSDAGLLAELDLGDSQGATGLDGELLAKKSTKKAVQCPSGNCEDCSNVTIAGPPCEVICRGYAQFLPRTSELVLATNYVRCYDGRGNPMQVESISMEASLYKISGSASREQIQVDHVVTKCDAIVGHGISECHGSKPLQGRRMVRPTQDSGLAEDWRAVTAGTYHYRNKQLKVIPGKQRITA